MEKYKLIRSSRRTLQIEVNKDCELIIRAPFGMAEAQIISFIEEKKQWINKALWKAEKLKENKTSEPEIFAKELRELTLKARKYIPGQVKLYADKLGVTYGKITIRHQKSRWGSCSAKGNLNFNCLLMLTPNEVIDYVIVHELCHRKHMNHSTEFWNEVRKILPEFEIQRNWLKKNGNGIIDRVHEREEDEVGS